MGPIPDLTRYNPPGVYTELIDGPQIGLQASNPNAVAVFGLARGYQTDVETITIPADGTEVAGPTNSQPLRQKGIDASTIKVTNVATGVEYAAQTTTSPPNGDYVIVATTGPSGTNPNYDTTYQLRRVTGGNLNALTDVQVTYQFTNENYYSANLFTDFDDVVTVYGPAFDANGAIISELTLAASLAFNAGAGLVFCAAVVNSGSPQVQDYNDALAKFEGVAGIAVVVCANGNSNLFSAVKDHVRVQSLNKYERRAILGTDGSGSDITSSERITAAQALASSRVALVSPSVVNYYNTSLSKVVPVGGQYAAASLAGIAVSQSPALPLTRKSVPGLLSVPNVSDSQKSVETQAGLLVIENNSNSGGLRVRHGVTTNPSNLLTKEWSILSQQDAMAYRVRSYFDNDGLIGSIITPTTVAAVKASAQSALSSLTQDQTILDFQNLKVRQSTSQLDVIEISYEWRASLPMNYIIVRFTLNVTSGDVTDTTQIAA